MKDLRPRLERLRADARDFALMSRRAKDAEKHERFKRLGDELAIEALELELILKQTEHLDSGAQNQVVEFKPSSERKRG